LVLSTEIGVEQKPVRRLATGVTQYALNRSSREGFGISSLHFERHQRSDRESF
jgi:hypothetical protein